VYRVLCAERVKKAASEGHADAQAELGSLVLANASNEEQALSGIELLRMSAEQGSAVGCLNLALQMMRMDEEELNAQAVQLLRVAAEKNEALAQFLLASCLENGIGADIDLVEARKYYILSAQNGNEEAKQYLAESAVAQISKPKQKSGRFAFVAAGIAVTAIVAYVVVKRLRS
jgi:TPR repeat protein